MLKNDLFKDLMTMKQRICNINCYMVLCGIFLHC